MNAHKYVLVSCMYMYGFFRTALVAPPLEPNEYITDRARKLILYTCMVPFGLPFYLYVDVKNIEHRMRKMPGKIDSFPW